MSGQSWLRTAPRSPVGQALLSVAVLASLALSGCASEDKKAIAQAQRGNLKSSEDVGVLTRAQIDANQAAGSLQALAGPAACDVAVKQLVYASMNPDEDSSQLSAALLVPGGAQCAGPFTVIAYAHATSRDRSRTLAKLDDPETLLLISMFASKGYVVVATDYLGYGKSNFAYHPYLDTRTEATSVIDSIRAARGALGLAQVALTGRVLLAGYSQGGQAALATQRAIEQGGAGDITVTATGAMSGPYDLNLTFQQNLRLLPGINNDTPGQAGTETFVLGSAVADKLLDFANSNTVSDALRGESVTGWAAKAPVLLCGGARDTTVTFANAAAAAKDLSAKGASVTIVDVDSDPSYATAVPPAGTPASALESYHSKIVPPLCFQAVRDRLFAPYR